MEAIVEAVAAAAEGALAEGQQKHWAVAAQKQLSYASPTSLKVCRRPEPPPPWASPPHPAPPRTAPLSVPPRGRVVAIAVHFISLCLSWWQVTLRQIVLGRSKSLAECLSMEYRMAQHFMRGQDFFEGVRAMVCGGGGVCVERESER